MRDLPSLMGERWIRPYGHACWSSPTGSSETVYDLVADGLLMSATYWSDTTI